MKMKMKMKETREFVHNTFIQQLIFNRINFMFLL